MREYLENELKDSIIDTDLNEYIHRLYIDVDVDEQEISYKLALFLKNGRILYLRENDHKVYKLTDAFEESMDDVKGNLYDAIQNTINYYVLNKGVVKDAKKED